MIFNEVAGHEHLKSHLIKTVEERRIAHAQLFNGPEGNGALLLAVAYAQLIISQNMRLNSFKSLGYNHPDLHFSYPTINQSKPKLEALSDNYKTDWLQFMEQQPYGGLFDWYQHLGIDNKQGFISVNEAQQIHKKLTLKSYGGGYKVLIIWMAESLNVEASNKLLKLIEEPLDKTVILLITNDKEQLLNTITSRCQVLEVPSYPEQVIANYLITQNVSEVNAHHLAQASNGNLNYAIQLSHNHRNDEAFEDWFIQWVRIAFKAKGNKKSILPLLDWSENLAQQTREVQKQFLLFCLSFFRQALLLNYGLNSLVYYQPNNSSFELRKFAPFIHENNIGYLFEALEKAIVDIERNGNGKLIFSDLSIKLTRFLHLASAA